MKNKRSIRFRRIHNEVKRDVITVLTEILKKADDNKLDLDDYRGSLIVNQISDDDQESVVIQSIYLKYGVEHCKVIACCGVFEEEYDQDLEDYSVEFLLNILEATEEAIEE
jgi:hypothetical protein